MTHERPFDEEPEDPEDTVSLLRTGPGPTDEEEGDTTVVRTGGRRVSEAGEPDAPEPTDDDDTARVDRDGADEGDGAVLDQDRGDRGAVRDDTVVDDEKTPGADDTLIVGDDTSTTQPAGDTTASSSRSEPSIASRSDPGAPGSDAAVGAGEAGTSLAPSSGGAGDPTAGPPSGSGSGSGGDTIRVERAARSVEGDTAVGAGDDDTTHEVARAGGVSIAVAVAARLRVHDRPADPAPTQDPREARPGEARPGETRPGETQPGEARRDGPAPVPVKPVMAAPRRRGRRSLKPAPVPPGYGGRAVVASGAGSVSTYGIREIPRPPAPAQPLATRSVERLDGGLVSVAKRSRRLAFVTMGGFALSIVVSVVGLVLIARSAILGY